MDIFRAFVTALCLAILLTACVNKPEKERPRVNCPACGSEFDALYQKRF